VWEIYLPEADARLEAVLGPDELVRMVDEDVHRKEQGGSGR